MASNNLPNPQSYDQILGDALSSYATKQGINDFNVGSSITSFMEVLALVTARASGDIFQILRDYSVDRATGDALQRLAKENNVTPITAKPATGQITITDTSFTKISTKIYAGSTPPNVGSIQINVSDASQFPTSGSIYIGRGTSNVEGPRTYSVAPYQNGNHWVITLDTGTTKFHNLSETVILAQGGNRTIPVNTMVTAPSVGAISDLQYSVTTQAIILDGETTVSNVNVNASIPGSDSNVPIGAIKKASTLSFPSAVTNPLPFTSGQDNETDDKLRIRIKRQLASTGLGTATAVESSVIGATPSDEQATILSDNLIQTSLGAILYISDGSAYEAKTKGVGLESIVDSAIGGEQFFQLITGGRQAPIAKAFLQTYLVAPFSLIGSDTLAVIVGGQTYQHVFSTSDFRSPGSVTAYEITASINGNTSLAFEATTSDGGKRIVIRAKNESHDSIQITTPTTSGRDASILLGFPVGQVDTLRLYKNKIPLNKDGSTATVFSQAQQLWSPSIADGNTLILSVDGTAPITYTINDSDFIASSVYTNVSATNSLNSWVEVFNNKLTGITAEVVGQQISLTSNLGANNRAAVSINPLSDLVLSGMFTSSIGLSSLGAASDYTLDRNTAQFQLAAPLEVGDQLAAGTEQTEARVQSTEISAGNVTFASDAYVWMLIDNFGEIIPTGVAGSTLLGVQKPSTNIVQYTSNVANAFSNVIPGDYVIVWTQDLIAANRLEGRVQAVTPTTIDLLVTPAEFAAATIVAGALFTQGFVVLRSSKSPQKFRIAAGTFTLDEIAQNFQYQTDSLVFTVEQEKYLVIRSRTKDTSGSILMVTADLMGQLMNLPIGLYDQSKSSLIAFYDSHGFTSQLPLFIHASFASGTAVDTPNSYISSFTSSISLASRDPNELVSMLHPYGSINDAQPYPESVQETAISGAVVNITNSNYVRRLRSVDRFYIANPLDFGSADTIVSVIDNDLNSQSFEIPLYRNAKTNITQAVNPNNFNAYDTASDPLANFSSAFLNFDFSNFKALMKARKVLKHTPSQSALLYRSARWGRSGENIYVGYSYPSIPLASISSTVVVTDAVRILISLKSGALISSSIDTSTEWNISVTPNTPSAGIDQVTYTYSGTGTLPGLTLVGGEYVSISNQTEFNTNNTGIFRISTEAGFTPTATQFSVQRPTGAAVSESGKATLVLGSIIFYASLATTASDINTYVNANLSSYVTSSIVNDGGTGGSGVISLSTYEDSGFIYENVQLKDGINWIAYSNLMANVIIISGNTSIGSNTISNVFPTGDIYPGASISGNGITGGTTVLSINGATIIMSAVATANNTSASFTFVNTGTPQFVFKKPLSLPTDVGYAFNEGEDVRLIPTTIDQVRRFVSILAVSGITTVGSIGVVEGASKLEIATNTLGSDGSVQIIGGIGNSYEVPVLDSAIKTNNSLMSVSVNSVAAQGVHSDQWFRLYATNAQKKESLFSSNSGVTIIGNSPSTGQSTVKLLYRDLNQRYFGKPRHHIRTQSRNFRIEKQGGLTCLSWDGNGSNPVLRKSLLNFNDSGGGTLNVFNVLNTNESQYVILTGNTNFNEISIGDLITISGMLYSENNGTFLVTGVSDDGKNLRVLNSSGVDQFSHGTFTLVTNPGVGGAFTIGASTLIAGTDFVIAGTTAQTAINLSAAIGALANVTSSSNSNIVTVTATLASASVAISYSGTGTITVSGAYLTGDTFVTGNFSASSQVSEGDTLTIEAPFSILNQGKFRVIRRYDNSVWFENANTVEEEKNLPYNSISLGFDATTSFKVNANNHSIYLNWNGLGLEPLLGNAQVGDVVTFGADFAAANQGPFMVLRSGAKLQEITSFVMPPGSQFTLGGPGAYFLINSAGDINQYYVWFNVNGTNSDPLVAGRVGLPVSVLNGDTATLVASKTQLVINVATGLTATDSDGILVVTTINSIETSDAAYGTMPSPFSVDMLQQGRRTFLECVNPSATNESAVLVSGSTLQCHRPQIQFFEYEASVPGDLFTITGNAFGSSNVGSYVITKVIDRDTAIIGSALASVSNISLNTIETSTYIQEASPYYGYKRVLFASADPNSPTRSLLIFDTNEQSSKIDDAAGVQISSLSKLNFNTAIRNGIDSYKYNTGLIAEANRIVYGDPRDPETYPGVGAAGANIFVREPLTRRIQLALNIRLNTGVPFAQTSQQVRNSVSSLVNSNPIGVSIAISSVISVVNAIPGVLAVSISSPLFNSSNDLIVLSPGEQSIITDPTLDISVSQVGT